MQDSQDLAILKSLYSLYIKYINEISKLIKNCGDLDLYELEMLYNHLLRNGFLSTKPFEYDLNTSKNHQPIWGAFIASGNGVCKHIAANQNDVFQLLGYYSSFIFCFPTPSNSLKKYPDLYYLKHFSLNNKVNYDGHSLVGIFDDNEYLIVDSTNEKVGFIDQNHEIILSDISNPCSKQASFSVPCIASRFNLPEEHKKYLLLLQKESYLKKRTKEELEIKYSEMQKKLLNMHNDFQIWKSNLLELIQEIEFMVQKLANCSDDLGKKLKR